MAKNTKRKAIREPSFNDLRMLQLYFGLADSMGVRLKCLELQGGLLKWRACQHSAIRKRRKKKWGGMNSHLDVESDERLFLRELFQVLAPHHHGRLD